MQMKDYVDMVVDNNTKKIIRRGYATPKRRIELVNDLYTEFQKAQGNQVSKIHTELRDELISICTVLQRLTIAKLLLARDFEYSKHIIDSLSIPFHFKEATQKSVLFIDSQINQRKRRRDEISGKLSKTEATADDKPTRQSYIDSMFVLGISVELGYKVDMSITLAEFASLIKIKKEKEKSYERIKRGSTKR